MQISAESLFKHAPQLCDDLLEDAAIKGKLTRLTMLIVGGGALYGFTMGLRQSFLQALVAAFKVPGLFFITLLICLPTLHFLGLLFGSKISFQQTAVILLSGVAVTAVLLGSFAPISIFFLLSQSQYAFLMLMHVGVLAVSGVAGLMSIRKNFGYIRAQLSPEEEDDSGSLLFSIWMFLYMFVGSQMAYIMAPFVGRGSAFMLFRVPQENFYTYVGQLIMEMVR